MGLRVSKEEFVKKLLPLFLEQKPISEKHSLETTPEEILEDDYDMIREAGLIIVDEDKLRKRFSLCDKCDWKDKCREVRLDKEEVCPDLLAPHEILKEILGE